MVRALQKITPSLWFDSEAQEAARFHVAIFENARIGEIGLYGKEGFEIHGRPEGSVMTVEFEIAGQSFTALNGGPHFQVNEAISFQLPCETQEVIDHYWERLAAGGEIQQCGWLKDKFGVSLSDIPGGLTGDDAGYRQGGAGDARYARHEESRYRRIASGL